LIRACRYVPALRRKPCNDVLRSFLFKMEGFGGKTLREPARLFDVETVFRTCVPFLAEDLPDKSNLR